MANMNENVFVRACSPLRSYIVVHFNKYFYKVYGKKYFCLINYLFGFYECKCAHKIYESNAENVGESVLIGVYAMVISDLKSMLSSIDCFIRKTGL